MKVYYDGLCPLCAREIDHYRKVDVDGRIVYVDIAASGFDAEAEGLDPKKVHKVFHVRADDEQLLTGVDGFIAIWKKLDTFKPLTVLAESPLRPAFDLGYKVFATFRPYLPKRKCDTGACEIR